MFDSDRLIMFDFNGNLILNWAMKIYDLDSNSKSNKLIFS